MITAELSHRDYVSAYTIAMTFADLEFNGNGEMVEPLNMLADFIKHKKERKHKVKIEVLETTRDNNIKRIKLLTDELKDLKKIRNRLIAILAKEGFAKIKQIKAEIKQLEEMNYKLYYLIEEIEDLDNQWNHSYSNYTELSAFKNLLAELGFVPTSSHSSGKHTSLEHEFYQYCGNEEDLKKLAYQKLEAEKADLEKRCNNIKINFTDKLSKNELPHADSFFDEYRYSL